MPGRLSRLAAGIVAVLLMLLVAGIALDALVEQLARGGIGVNVTPTGTPGPAPAPTLTATEIAAVFASPHDLTTTHGRLALRVEPIGSLILPTGGVAASDPFFTDVLPFTERLAPGAHPVSLLVARFPSGDERVVAALVGEPKAVSWRPASVTPGAAEGTGYAVDSGTAAFLSPEAAAAATRTLGAYSTRMLDGLHATEHDSWDWADVATDTATGANVMAFASGFGDGMYGSSFGFDAGGRAVALLTDFAILDRP